MNHPSNRAILTVSFGTSVKETRIKTLEAIENAFRSAYPGTIHSRAWTSRFLRSKVLETEGITIHSVSESLSQLLSDGIQEVYIQPTFVTNGSEYQKLIQEITPFHNQFRTLCVGSPLMECANDFAPILTAITDCDNYPRPQSDELLLFMGHGTTDGEYALYDKLDQAFQSYGLHNTFLKTMQSPTALDEIISIADERKIRQITLAPFMIVAGRHAIHDMAGDHPNSWKSRLEQAGFHVHCEMKGLGELPEIQQLLLHKLKRQFP